jgi:membrane-associated phospholipid phosphatase
MKYSYYTNLILLLIFLLCFSVVMMTGTNEEIFISVNSAAAHSSSFIWANFTILGDTLTAVPVMLLFIRKRPDLVWAGIIASVIGTLAVNVVKTYYNVPRPPTVISRELINITGPVLLSHSFPSGHTVTIFTIAGILMFFFRSFYLRISLIILALLVGISRVAVGVHWPGDVLAGAAFGIIFATAGVFFVRKLGWNRMIWAQLTAGFILILADIYLLIFHATGYAQAVYFQRLLAIIFLLAGIREYYLLLKCRRNDPVEIKMP